MVECIGSKSEVGGVLTQPPRFECRNSSACGTFDESRATRVIEVVLHQHVMDDFTILAGVALILHHLPPHGRPKDKLHCYIHYSWI